MLLAIGVICAVIAVIMDGKAYGSHRWRAAEGFAKKHYHLYRFRCSDGPVGAVHGSCHDAWKSARPLQHRRVSDFGRAAFLFIWNIYFMKKPLVGEPVNFSGLFKGPLSGHVLGLLGGLVWGTGMVFNLVAASFTGVAISYAIGQSAPMVAALWGVLAWKEFKGSGSMAKVYLTLMFVSYGLAIFFVARANG